VGKHFIIFASIFLITACSTTSTHNYQLEPYSQYLPNLNQDNYSQALLLAQQRQLLSIKSLDKDLPQTSIISAEIKLQKAQYQTALKTLLAIDYTQLDQVWQAYYFDQVFRGFSKTHQYNKALSTLIIGYESNTFLQNQVFVVKIWDFITSLSITQLEQILYMSNLEQEQGWAELAIISKQHKIKDLILNWQEKHPKHLANSLINNNQEVYRISNIAILLPISGPLKAAATSIKNGIFATYFNSTNKPSLKIYDTNTESIESIFSKIDSNTDIIIGPLTKENVAKFSSINDSIPTIALNAIPESKKNLYELDFRVEKEAIQMANFAFLKGKRKAFIATSSNNKSERIFQAFKQQWLKLGGEIIATTNTETLDSAINEIQKALLINASKQRFANLKQTLNYNKINFTPRIRQDIDSIFLAFDNSQSKNIAPIFNYFYAAKIPKYATSSIYSNSSKHDIKDIIYPQSPWIKNDNSIPNEFFAIGVDAYTLALNINKLLILPRAYIAGKTGLLYLDNQKHIKRKLIFAKH
jgi:outer membrane PBP1 activator LpoA protein